jgi:hypothetical protein
VAIGISASTCPCGAASSIAHHKWNGVCRPALRLTACPRGMAPFPVPRPVGVDHLRRTEVVWLELPTTWPTRLPNEYSLLPVMELKMGKYI